MRKVVQVFCCLFYALLLTACGDSKLPEEGANGLPTAIAHIKIQTELDEQLLIHEKVESTEEYMLASLQLDGADAFTDVAFNNIRLRGRGHQSFAQPKKPYKIKLPRRESLLGLPAGEEWALLAGFQDGSLVANVLAMQLGQLLAMELTPVLVPVELSINNRYQGLYWLTPHKEVGKGRIELATGGLLLELGKDQAIDAELTDKDHYQWRTQPFDLPVQLHYPRLHKKANKQQQQALTEFAEIRHNLDELMLLLSEEGFAKRYGALLDKQSLARLLLVYQFTLNTNIREPQSIYLHRHPEGPFAFGPLWDFDSAFGGGTETDYFVSGQTDDVLASQQPGALFFQRLLQDKELNRMLKQEWVVFRNRGLGKLRATMASYFDLLDDSGAYQRDYQRWYRLQEQAKGIPRKSLREYEKDMNLWLDQRAGHMDALLKGWRQRIYAQSST